MRQRAQIRDRAALGKAGEKDALTRDAALELARNEGANNGARSQ